MRLSHTWFFDRLKKRASRGARGYPAASVAFYGPTDRLASKVVVGVTAFEGADVSPLERWYSPDQDARENPQLLKTVLRFLEAQGVKSVVMPDGLLGCPHEEGTAADAAHPAFAKLFVQTEYVASIAALVATRRRRSPGEPQAWAAHVAVLEGEVVGSMQFETDRARFLGRGRGIRAPLAVMDGRPLTNTVGTVLDPVFSLRRCLRIPPGATARVAFWTMVAPSRSEILDLADKHRDTSAFERAVTLAWTQAQVQLQHLGIGHDEAHLFQRLANRVLYSDPSLRPSPEDPISWR